MLAIHNLACVRDDRPLFSGLNDEIGPGDWVQIEGANGAGKTSLLRILAALAPPDDGEIRWRSARCVSAGATIIASCYISAIRRALRPP